MSKEPASSSSLKEEEESADLRLAWSDEQKDILTADYSLNRFMDSFSVFGKAAERVKALQQRSSTPLTTRQHKEAWENELRGGNVIAAAVPFHFFDVLNRTAGLTLNPNSCYNTNGGVNKEGKLVDTSKRWVIKEEHKKLLRRLYEKEVEAGLLDSKQVSFSECKNLETSLRVKRLQGYTYVSYQSQDEKERAMRVFSLYPFDPSKRAIDATTDDAEVMVPMQLNSRPHQ